MRMQQWEGRRRFREDKLARAVRGCFAQDDQSVANAAGSVVRADINANLQALVTNSSGISAPSTTWAYQFWADTTNGLMKQRNAANSAWITLWNLAGGFDSLDIGGGYGSTGVSISSAGAISADGAIVCKSVNATNSGSNASGFTSQSYDWYCTVLYNSATSGDNLFAQMVTEGTPATRGSITYNRGGGVVAYNTTSDYRLKDLYGPFTTSGQIIDAIPVYRGKMHGATIERPMFVAHKVAEGGAPWAVTGQKDAVDADGNIIPQQLNESSLVATLWAEVQSLRQRLAAANL